MRNSNTEHFGLLAIFCLQIICVGFLMYDAMDDLMGLDLEANDDDGDFLENFVVMTLIFSLIATGFRIWALISRQKAVEFQLRAASGRFAEVLDQYFEGWALTVSERDVAMLAIKGLEISQIAKLRSTKDGTVKAQLNAIYQKANVSGRPQLISIFVEELMDNILENNRDENKSVQ